MDPSARSNCDTGTHRPNASSTDDDGRRQLRANISREMRARPCSAPDATVAERSPAAAGHVVATQIVMMRNTAGREDHRTRRAQRDAALVDLRTHADHAAAARLEPRHRRLEHDLHAEIAYGLEETRGQRVAEHEAGAAMMPQALCAIPRDELGRCASAATGDRPTRRSTGMSSRLIIMPPNNVNSGNGSRSTAKSRPSTRPSNGSGSSTRPPAVPPGKSG